jgi:hypothetical protein
MAGLLKLGVLREPRDLEKMLIGLLEGQTAAHYDPEDKTYYLLATNASPAMLDGISSHELCHALQDQHHDLRAFLIGDTNAALRNGDATLAKECLVEGEATLVMMTWMVRQGAGEDAAAEALVSAAVRSQAALGMDAFLDLAESGAAGLQTGLGNIGEAMADLRGIPRFFLEMLYSTYFRGAAAVETIRAAGGWAAVDALYAEPPESTEQILHPAKLAPPRDLPRDVALPAVPAGWRLVEEDVLGEAGIRVLLREWDDPDSPDLEAEASAAAGWGGDRYRLFRRDRDGKDLLVWNTAWDTEADAAEFGVAYRMAMERRFPAARPFGSPVRRQGSICQVWEVASGRWLTLSRGGRTVSVVDTGDRSLSAVLLP